MIFKIPGLTKREVLLTKTEAQQIRDMIWHRKETGWYYGNKRQFLIREMHIENKLKDLTLPDKGVE